MVRQFLSLGPARPRLIPVTARRPEPVSADGGEGGGGGGSADGRSAVSGREDASFRQPPSRRSLLAGSRTT